MTQRKQYESRLKATVAQPAIKNQRTIAQIASEYGVHPNQVTHWKKQLIEALPQFFTSFSNPSDAANEQLVGELYRQIGQLKVELDWVKKKGGLSR